MTRPLSVLEVIALGFVAGIIGAFWVFYLQLPLARTHWVFTCSQLAVLIALATTVYIILLGTRFQFRLVQWFWFAVGVGPGIGALNVIVRCLA